jgi:hypothetical protein
MYGWGRLSRIHIGLGKPLDNSGRTCHDTGLVEFCSGLGHANANWAKPKEFPMHFVYKPTHDGLFRVWRDGWAGDQFVVLTRDQMIEMTDAINSLSQLANVLITLSIADDED